MAIERARAHVVPKPWGSIDLRPWSEVQPADEAVGEIWFDRFQDRAFEPALLLKLLFTRHRLSIQVHPSDVFAQAMGLSRGKTEAWYVLSATSDAEVAVGLKRQITPLRLHRAIDDGSIADLVQWRPVTRDDVIYVPAGTIHSIGAGLVIAEIQQRSDTTFRLFDFGRHRELHVDNAIAVSDLGPAPPKTLPKRLGESRLLLLESPPFVLERIALLPRSAWNFFPQDETWLLVIEGCAQVRTLKMRVGDAFFAQGESVRIEVGDAGLMGLVAYPGPASVQNLLSEIGPSDPQSARPSVLRIPNDPSKVAPESIL